jgi:ATP-grasp domain, R2K clade family 2
LWRPAGRLGWAVERLASWRVPEDLRSVSEPVLYLEAMFGPTLAEQFGLRLLEPSVDWLPRLPDQYRKRWVYLTTLREARLLAEPAFVKPPNDKSFPAKVYLGSELPDGYDDDSPVLVAEVVTWEKEFRCFVLDRQPRAMSIYLRWGELQRENNFASTEAELAEAKNFLCPILADERIDLPRAAVLDIGVIADRGWAVIEQNSAWGAGLYGCDPEQVLEVLRHAAVPA